MSERLRVSFCLSNSGIGGTELNAVRTVERLDRDRFDIEVLALTDYPPLRERYEAAGVAYRVFPVRGRGDAVRQGWRLAAHLRRRSVAVFHAHDSYGNIVGVPWARMVGVPAVIASRRWWTETPRPGHGAANRVVFRFAHAVVANTPAVADLTASEGVASHKIHVVPNFLDEESFGPPAAEVAEDLRGEFEVPPESPLVGIVALLRPEKDHLTLLRAAGRLSRKHPDAHYLLIGEGECRTEIEAERRRLRLEDRVHLAGLREGLGNLHHLFDVSVLCSRSEAFSNSLLEAMAAGNPVVASDVGGNPDAVKHGETGLLFPVGDDGALAAALDRLLDDPSLARRLGAAGRDVARRRYTPGAALSSLHGLYDSLTGHRAYGRSTAGAA